MAYLIDQLNSLHKTARARWVSEILRNPGLHRRVKAFGGGVTDTPEGIRGLKEDLVGYNSVARVSDEHLSRLFSHLSRLPAKAPPAFIEMVERARPSMLQRLNVRDLPVKKTDKNTLKHTQHIARPDATAIQSHDNLRRLAGKSDWGNNPWYETVLNNDLQKFPDNFKIEDHLEYLIPTHVRTPHAIRASLLPTNPERFIYKGTKSYSENFGKQIDALNTSPTWWSALPNVARGYAGDLHKKVPYYISSKSPEGRKILPKVLADWDVPAELRGRLEAASQLRRKFILDRLNPAHPSFPRYHTSGTRLNPKNGGVAIGEPIPGLSSEGSSYVNSMHNLRDLADKTIHGADVYYPS